MNKVSTGDLINLLVFKKNLSKKQAGECVHLLLDHIEESLKLGKRVTLSNICTLFMIKTKSREYKGFNDIPVKATPRLKLICRMSKNLINTPAPKDRVADEIFKKFGDDLKELDAL